MNDIREFLNELPFLAGINPDFIDHLAEAAYEATFRPGQMIIKEGSLGKDLFLITEGHVQIFRQEAGQRIDLAIRGPGDLIGEMSLIDDSPRFATVFAREPVRAIVFPEDSITSLWLDHPDILIRIMAVVNNRLREADLLKIADLQQKNQELNQAYRDLQEAQQKVIEIGRMEREIELARDLQRNILPDTFPDIPGLDIAARYLPADKVGGDFYDIIPLNDGKIGIVIADVSGKGLPAAIYMALSRSLIRAEAYHGKSPAEVLERFHHLLLEITRADTFVTVFYGILDMDGSRLTYARAGHTFPFLVKKHSGECIELKPMGTVLGITQPIRLEEQTITTQSGDVLILYTDGLMDVNSPSGEFFGLENLQRLLCLEALENSEAICDRIIDQAQVFQQNARQFDDIALMVIRITHPESQTVPHQGLAIS